MGVCPCECASASPCDNLACGPPGNAAQGNRKPWHDGLGSSQRHNQTTLPEGKCLGDDRDTVSPCQCAGGAAWEFPILCDSPCGQQPRQALDRGRTQGKL